MADETTLNVMAAELAEIANTIMVIGDHAQVAKQVKDAIATFEAQKKTPDMKNWAQTLRVGLYEFLGVVNDRGNLDTFFVLFTKAFEETSKLTKNKTILAKFEKIMTTRMKRAIGASERRTRVA